MITHSVFFTLKHDQDSPEEAAFLEKAMSLQSISTVRNLRCVRQLNLKSKFKLGLIMQFGDQAAYDHYHNHPDHRNFVTNTWLPEVDDFMELDYIE